MANGIRVIALAVMAFLCVMVQAASSVYVCPGGSGTYAVDTNTIGQERKFPNCPNMQVGTASDPFAVVLMRWHPNDLSDPWAIWQPLMNMPVNDPPWSVWTPAGWVRTTDLNLSGAEASAVLHWATPLENADGTPLTDLTGFSIYAGPTPTELTRIARINDPTATSYTIPVTGSGQIYFGVVAVNSAGIESGFSVIVSRSSVPGDPELVP